MDKNTFLQRIREYDNLTDKEIDDLLTHLASIPEDDTDDTQYEWCKFCAGEADYVQMDQVLLLLKECIENRKLYENRKR